MSDTPRTEEAWYKCLALDAMGPIRDLSMKLERELNAMTEEREELREEIKSLKETILDQESHILELQARRPYTPGYTAEP